MLKRTPKSWFIESREPPTISRPLPSKARVPFDGNGKRSLTAEELCCQNNSTAMWSGARCSAETETSRLKELPSFRRLKLTLSVVTKTSDRSQFSNVTQPETASRGRSEIAASSG